MFSFFTSWHCVTSVLTLVQTFALDWQKATANKSMIELPALLLMSSSSSCTRVHNHSSPSTMISRLASVVVNIFSHCCFMLCFRVNNTRGLIYIFKVYRYSQKEMFRFSDALSLQVGIRPHHNYHQKSSRPYIHYSHVECYTILVV